MGEIWFEGPDAYKFLQTVATNNFKNVHGSGAYSHVTNEKGGVIDDVIAFCVTPEKFLIVVNSAAKDKDFAWFLEKAKGFDVKVTDDSDNYSMLALQGPNALTILEKLDPQIKDLPRFNIKRAKIFDADVYITRTGYTGEDGVEIMGGADTIVKLFDWCLANGFRACGLGSRDVLRLEAGYLLSGSDMDESRTPYEAGYGWVVKLKKEEDFIGKEALAKQKAEGVKEQLQGFVITGPGIAREGAIIFDREGREIGRLTSATYSPLYKAVCTGYAPSTLAEGDEVQIELRGRKVPARKIKMPFYKKI
jgi:aminomethyltransferase